MTTSTTTARPVTRQGDVCRTGDSAQRWIGFDLAGQSYAVPILSVQEVLASAEIEPVPGSPRGVLGVINLRGQIVTVFDLRIRLGLPPATVVAGPLVVFDGGQEIVAARVDRVADVRRIADAAIKPAPQAGETPNVAVMGLITRPGEMTTLLDPKVLFS